MSYTNFQNYVTPANDIVLNQMQVGLMELVFPIGSTYITQTEVNPSTILGFGTWERVKGKVLVGLDENDTAFNTIGKTGGEKEHTLTINEMPSHGHNFTDEGRVLYWDSGLTDAGDLQSGTGVQTTWNTSTKETGGSQPHNNLQPYEVIGYMWIRRA